MTSRRTIAVAVAATMIAGLGAVAATTDLLTAQADSPAPAAAPASLSTAAVQKGNLSSEREFKATVSFGDKWTIPTSLTGAVTESRPAGSTVDFGEVLIRLDNKPLFLGKGETPMYRELTKINTKARDANGKRVKLQSAPDVRQLQQFLLDAGFNQKGKLEVDGLFGGITEAALKAWQASVGLPTTGKIDKAQLVFEPSPVRIDAEPRLGTTFAGLEVTRAQSVVLVDTSNRDRSALRVGATVKVTVPDADDLSGKVTAQEQATASDGTAIWRTTVTVDGTVSGSNAKVVVTQLLAQDVLLVPVVGLLALAEGGFAVEVSGGATPTLVRVELGEVLNGQAEVSGDVAEGDQIVIPT